MFFCVDICLGLVIFKVFSVRSMCSVKNKFIASGLLAASVACSVGQNGVFAGSRWSEIFKNFIGRNKVKVLSILAALSAYWVRRNVTNVREIGDSKDIGVISRNISNMFNSMSVDDFEDAMRNAEFYQLYLTYKFTCKFGYNGLVPISEERKAIFKKILLSAMERQLREGTAMRFFLERMSGSNSLGPIRKALSYIDDLVHYSYDGKGGNSLPMFLASGTPGVGKSQLFFVICEFLSGREDRGSFDSLSLVGLDEKAANAKMFGSPPSYQNSGVKPKEIIGKATDPNQMFLPLLIDEVDKTDGAILDAFLQCSNEKRAPWNYNGKEYPLEFGIYFTANFQEHHCAEAMEEFGKKVGTNFFDGMLEKALRRDATNFLGGPLMSRLKYITFFKAPTVGEAKEDIKRRIKETQGSSSLTNFFIDPGSESKVIDLVYKGLLHDTDAPKLPYRDIGNGVYPMLNRVASDQNGGISLAGRKVNLSVDEHDNLRAEFAWRDYF